MRKSCWQAKKSCWQAGKSWQRGVDRQEKIFIGGRELVGGVELVKSWQWRKIGRREQRVAQTLVLSYYVLKAKKLDKVTLLKIGIYIIFINFNS